MALWEWKPSFSTDVDVILAQSEKMADGTIPPDIPYVSTGPVEYFTLSAFGLTYEEVLAEKAKRGTKQTYISKTGNTITGWVTNVSGPELDGSPKSEITVSLKIPYPGS